MRAWRSGQIGVEPLAICPLLMVSTGTSPRPSLTSVRSSPLSINQCTSLGHVRGNSPADLPLALCRATSRAHMLPNIAGLHSFDSSCCAAASDASGAPRQRAQWLVRGAVFADLPEHVVHGI